MSNDKWAPSPRFPEPSRSSMTPVDVLRALADPVRLHVVQCLLDGQLHPCSTEEYGLTIHKSTLSHHFRILRESGVTSTLVRGREHGVILRTIDLEELLPGLLHAITPRDSHRKNDAAHGR